jgi:hypothetical protein
MDNFVLSRIVSFFRVHVVALERQISQMGRAKFHCAYCDRAFEDSQDARKRHFKGRNHRANVKLWYDSFAGT